MMIVEGSGWAQPLCWRSAEGLAIPGAGRRDWSNLVLATPTPTPLLPCLAQGVDPTHTCCNMLLHHAGLLQLLAFADCCCKLL